MISWEKEHQEALDKLVHDLNHTSTLNTVDYSKPFGLATDASDVALECCLFQCDGEGREVPISFGSLKLSSTQTRWSTIEWEAYAVIWTLNKYRSWILLSEVQVYSDHNPLTYLINTATKSAKLSCWALTLQEYNLDFNYKKGQDNIAADLMSRI